jgi:hypothetical protein
MHNNKRVSTKRLLARQKQMLFEQFVAGLPWVTYSGGTLLSWVPPQLLTVVQSGIDVNPECCIRWME